jgi:phosphoglycerol transferase MdoB-like AlkP superfamily enzyme
MKVVSSEPTIKWGYNPLQELASGFWISICFEYILIVIVSYAFLLTTFTGASGLSNCFNFSCKLLYTGFFLTWQLYMNIVLSRFYEFEMVLCKPLSLSKYLVQSSSSCLSILSIFPSENLWPKSFVVGSACLNKCSSKVVALPHL